MGRRANRRSHFQDLATTIGSEGKATTKQRLSKEERTYKATVAKVMAQMVMGKPSPTTPLYSPRPAVSTSRANSRIHSKTRRFQSHRGELGNDTSPTQRSDPGDPGGKGGSLRASEPENQILRTRPSSIRPCPQGGNCWDTVTSRGGSEGSSGAKN